jgi:SPP1 family predicted phage head-tail adaptor
MLHLQQQTESRDALGGSTPVWTTTATVWGGVEALSGSEAFVADQVQSSLQVRIVIRYGSVISAIDTTWRVMDKNTLRKYDIKSVVMPEHRSRPNTVIELQCFEGETDDQ